MCVCAATCASTNVRLCSFAERPGSVTPSKSKHSHLCDNLLPGRVWGGHEAPQVLFSLHHVSLCPHHKANGFIKCVHLQRNGKFPVSQYCTQLIFARTLMRTPTRNLFCCSPYLVRLQVMDGLKQGIEQLADEGFTLLELQYHKLAPALVADLEESVTGHVLQRDSEAQGASGAGNDGRAFRQIWKSVQASGAAMLTDKRGNDKQC